MKKLIILIACLIAFSGCTSVIEPPKEVLIPIKCDYQKPTRPIFAPNQAGANVLKLMNYTLELENLAEYCTK